MRHIGSPFVGVLAFLVVLILWAVIEDLLSVTAGLEINMIVLMTAVIIGAGSFFGAEKLSELRGN